MEVLRLRIEDAVFDDQELIGVKTGKAATDGRPKTWTEVSGPSRDGDANGDVGEVGADMVWFMMSCYCRGAQPKQISQRQNLLEKQLTVSSTR